MTARLYALTTCYEIAMFVMASHKRLSMVGHVWHYADTIHDGAWLSRLQQKHAEADAEKCNGGNKRSEREKERRRRSQEEPKKAKEGMTSSPSRGNRKGKEKENGTRPPKQQKASKWGG